MRHGRRPAATLVAGLILLAIVPLPLASAFESGTCKETSADWDVDEDDPGWIHVNHPLSGQTSPSRYLRMYALSDGGPDAGSFSSGDVVNGMGAYVHDLGCQTANDEARDFCISAVPGWTGEADSSERVDPTLAVEAPELSGRDDDWRIAFFPQDALGKGQIGPTVEASREKRDSACDPQTDVAGQVPGGTRYAVIWIDATALAEPDRRDPDAAENLLPRGVQTRTVPPSAYTARFIFNVCADSTPNIPGSCD